MAKLNIHDLAKELKREESEIIRKKKALERALKTEVSQQCYDDLKKGVGAD